MSRNLGRAVFTYLKSDAALAARLLTWTAAFPYAVMNALRGGTELGMASERLPREVVEQAAGADNVPLAVSVR